MDCFSASSSSSSSLCSPVSSTYLSNHLSTVNYPSSSVESISYLSSSQHSSNLSSSCSSSLFSPLTVQQMSPHVGELPYPTFSASYDLPPLSHDPYTPILPWTDDLAIYSTINAFTPNGKICLFFAPICGAVKRFNVFTSIQSIHLQNVCSQKC